MMLAFSPRGVHQMMDHLHKEYKLELMIEPDLSDWSSPSETSYDASELSSDWEEESPFWGEREKRIHASMTPRGQHAQQIIRQYDRMSALRKRQGSSDTFREYIDYLDHKKLGVKQQKYCPAYRPQEEEEEDVAEERELLDDEEEMEEKEPYSPSKEERYEGEEEEGGCTRRGDAHGLVTRSNSSWQQDKQLLRKKHRSGGKRNTGVPSEQQLNHSLPAVPTLNLQRLNSNADDSSEEDVSPQRSVKRAVSTPLASGRRKGLKEPSPATKEDEDSSSSGSEGAKRAKSIQRSASLPLKLKNFFFPMSTRAEATSGAKAERPKSPRRMIKRGMPTPRMKESK